MSPGSSVSILKTQASLEVPRLLGVSIASSKESKRTSLVPDCCQWFISHQKCSCSMHVSRGSSVSILKTLASLEVPRLLGVSRASSKESRRTCFVPDCSQWCITRQECSMNVTRKLYEDLQVISCTFCS